MSRYPLTHDEEDSRLIHSLQEELEKSRTCLKDLVSCVKAKKTRYRDGNHEWRILRAFEREDRALRIIGLKKVKEAISTPALLNFRDLGIEFRGEYPSGDWLHPNLPAHENVWVEHGYRVAKKAGYTVSNLISDRMASCIVNHCEKLAGPTWTRALGRDFFGIENGNLSVIGEPDRGKGIYGGVPHSEPLYMNHRQGFSIIVYEGGQWHPQTIKIRDGKAYFNGKLYKA